MLSDTAADLWLRHAAAAAADGGANVVSRRVADVWFHMEDVRQDCRWLHAFSVIPSLIVRCTLLR